MFIRGLRLFGTFFLSLGHEIFNFYESIYNFMNEMIPGLSYNLLPDWEEELGILDECQKFLPTIEQRQKAVHTKYTTIYEGMNKSVYIEYAKSMGSIVIIYDLNAGQPFRVDKNRVDRMTGLGVDGARLWSATATFKWVVEISKQDPNKDYLHCRFLQMGPAHLQLIWVEV